MALQRVRFETQPLSRKLQLKKELLTSFGPVVSSTTLTEDEVVGPEQVAEGTRPYGIHGSRLEVDQDRARNILVRANFVVVNVDTLELEVVVALVQAIAINAVLVRDDLPELGTDLVTALSDDWGERRSAWSMYSTYLAGLEVDDFTHSVVQRQHVETTQHQSRVFHRVRCTIAQTERDDYATNTISRT